MPIFRASNINKRLTGSRNISPGNGGQVGPTRTPYCGVSISGPCALGNRCFGGSCGGVFKSNESACGIKEDCKCAFQDCKGFFICCGPGTVKWFVSPVSTAVSRNWYSRGDAVTCANSLMGSCGWFVASAGSQINGLHACSAYWDCYQPLYWTNNERDGANAVYQLGDGGKNIGYNVRAFRCTPT